MELLFVLTIETKFNSITKRKESANSHSLFVYNY